MDKYDLDIRPWTYWQLPPGIDPVASAARTFLNWGYLPRLEEGEVNIAEIHLASTLSDVICLRARREGTRIHYRVVDEYEDDPVVTYKLPWDVSDDPLSMRELIDLIDHTEFDGNIGLVSGYRQSTFDEGSSVEDAVGFVTVCSDFYPQLQEYYDDGARQWEQRVRREIEEE